MASRSTAGRRASPVFRGSRGAAGARRRSPAAAPAPSVVGRVRSSARLASHASRAFTTRRAPHGRAAPPPEPPPPPALEPWQEPLHRDYICLNSDSKQRVGASGAASAPEPGSLADPDRALSADDEDLIARLSKTLQRAARRKARPDPQGICVALDEAAETGGAAVVRAVCARKDKDGYTPLHFACMFGSAETVDILIDATDGLELAARNKYGEVPLHCAVDNRDTRTALEMTKLITTYSEDQVNAKSTTGRTPMHVAALHNLCDVAKVLMHAGAEWHSRTVRDKKKKETPLDLARSTGNLRVLAAIKEHETELAATGRLPAGTIMSSPMTRPPTGASPSAAAAGRGAPTTPGSARSRRSATYGPGTGSGRRSPVHMSLRSGKSGTPSPGAPPAPSVGSGGPSPDSMGGEPDAPTPSSYRVRMSHSGSVLSPAGAGAGGDDVSPLGSMASSARAPALPHPRDSSVGSAFTSGTATLTRRAAEAARQSLPPSAQTRAYREEEARRARMTQDALAKLMGAAPLTAVTPQETAALRRVVDAAAATGGDSSSGDGDDSPPSVPSGTGHVFLAHQFGSDAYYLGCSPDPQAYVGRMQVGNPYPLDLVARSAMWFADTDDAARAHGEAAGAVARVASRATTPVARDAKAAALTRGWSELRSAEAVQVAREAAIGAGAGVCGGGSVTTLYTKAAPRGPIAATASPAHDAASVPSPRIVELASGVKAR